MNKQILNLSLFLLISFNAYGSDLEENKYSEVNNIKEELKKPIKIEEKIILAKKLLQLTDDDRYSFLIDALKNKKHNNDKKVQEQLFWSTPDVFLNKKYVFAKDLYDNYQPLNEDLLLAVKHTIKSYNK